MDITLDVISMLAAVAFCAGFFDAIAGGGGLITLPALFLSGIEPISAIATNKFQAASATISATTTFAQKGMIEWREGKFLILTGLLGGAGGAMLVSLVNKRWLEACVPLMLICVAIYFAFSPKLENEVRQPKQDLREIALARRTDANSTQIVRQGGLSKGFEQHTADLRNGLRLQAQTRPTRATQPGQFCVSPARMSIGIFSFTMVPILGFYDGIFGPGTGSFLMVSFVLLCSLGMMRAIGFTKLANAASNVGSLFIFIINGAIIWPIAVTMAVTSFAGAQLGARAAVRVGPRLIKPMLIIVCCALAIKLLSAANNPLRVAILNWLS